MGPAKQIKQNTMPRAPKKPKDIPTIESTAVALPQAIDLSQLQHMRASVNLSTLRTSPGGEQRFFYVTRDNQVGWLGAAGERHELGFDHGLEANQAFHHVVKTWEEGK